MSSRQWIWCHGALTPSNPSRFLITPWVRFPQVLRAVSTLTLDVDLGTSVTPLDLSKATKLKDLLFRCGGSNVQWIAMALRTVQSKHLQQITIHPCAASARLSGEPVPQEWQDLDRTLLQFWTSHSIRPKIVYDPGKGVNDIRGLAPSLLPELTRRGAVDLVALV